MNVIDPNPSPERQAGDGPPSGPAPEVSVILSAYRSQETLGGCLEALRRQDRGDFEVVVVDSSPDEATAEVGRRWLAVFPELRLIRSTQRLLPHAARNRGVAEARGELLVCCDPDVYPRPDWLRKLVDAYRESGQPVSGALACYGDSWLDTGIHLCKFSKWLPGGGRRRVDMAPTANLLVDRDDFAAAGGFDGTHMLSDTTFSWRLVELGRSLRLAPSAVVEHHHLQGFRDFLRERYLRGLEFSVMRSTWHRHGRSRDLLFAAVSLLPVRLARVLALVLGQASRAGELGAALRTAPVWLAGHAASLLGEGLGHAGRALRRRSGAQDEPTCDRSSAAVPPPRELGAGS